MQAEALDSDEKMRRRTHRLVTAFIVVLSLLFSQLALAAYVCAKAAGDEGEAMVMEMASGEPCEGMASDGDQAALCLQHCANAPQSDAVKLPTVSLPVVVQVLLVPPALGMAQLQPHGYAASGEGRPPPEPLFLSTLRLRV